MQSSTFKKALLAGTAIVAVSGIMMAPSLPAYAAGEFAVDTNDSGDGVYETDINTGAAWTANDAHDLRVDETGTLLIVDGDSIGDADADQAAIAAAVTGKTLTLSDQSDDNAAETVEIDGDIDVGALAAMGLTINGDGVDIAGAGGDVLTLDVGGSIDLGTGALLIKADQNSAGSDVGVSVSGNITAASITLDAAGAGSDVTLTLDGTDAQTISGTIDGAAAGEGNIVVTNDGVDGVTFAGDIGGTKTVDTIVVNNDGDDLTATFQGDVATANGISFGDNSGTDTNTLVFDTAGGAIAVDGAVAGGGAADTNNISIVGGGAVTSDTAWTSNIDNVSITGTGSTLTTGGALTAGTKISVGAGAELDAQGGTVTGAIVVTGAGGTVTLGDGIDIAGSVDNTSGGDGVGVLTFEDTGTASTISGAIGATNSLATINVEGVAGSVTFNGAVNATTTNVGDGALADFNENVTTNIRFTDDGDVDLAAGKTLTGSVDNVTGADTQGTLIMQTTGGTTTVSGAVGTSNSLDQLKITGTGTAALGSSVNADDVTITGASTVTFADDVVTANGIDLGNNNATVTFANDANLTGNILSTGGANGTLNFTGDSKVTGQIGLAAGTGIAAVKINGAGDTVSVSGNSFMGALTTLADATMDFGGNATVSGAVTNGGTIRVAAGKTLTAGSFGGAGGYEIAVIDDGDLTLNAADFGSLASAGAINLAAESVNFVFTGNVAAGANVVLGTGGAASATAATVTDNSLIFNAALAANGSNLELTVTRNATSSLVSSPAALAIGTVLDTLTTSSDPGIQAVLDSLASASTVAALEEALEAAAPSVDGGAVAAGMNAITATAGITNTRLAALRDGEIKQTGMVAGNIAHGLQTWGQVFGSTATQDTRDGIDGFDADTTGLAAGIDSEMVAEDWVVGAAFSYAQSDVASDNANNSETEVDTYQATLYTNYDITDRAYISGQAAYAIGDNAVTRTNVGGAPGLIATGEYDSSAFSLRAETGRDYKDRRNMTLTPKVSANYLHYDSDDYTETGASGAGLNVESETMQVFELGLGLDIAWLYQQAGGAFFKPRVNGGVRYDFIGDEVETTSNFIAGGAAFRTTGAEPAQTTVDIGAGMTYYTTDNWELTADYDYESKEDYTSHAGVLRAGYRW